MFNRLVLVFASMLTLVFVGCTSSSRSLITAGDVPDLPRALRTVDSEIYAPSDVLKELRDEIAKGLGEESKGQDTILVDVFVTNWQGGNQYARHALGWMAPQSSHTMISAKVSMVDSRTGKILRAERLDVDLGSGWFGGLSSGAVKQLAQDVVRFALKDSAK